MRSWSGIAGIALATAGFAGPVAAEWLPGEPDALILAAPICWVAGLICGIIAWKTWLGKTAVMLNGLWLALIGVWIVFIAPSIRWG